MPISLLFAANLLGLQSDSRFDAFASSFALKVGAVYTNGGLPGAVIAFGENAKVLAVGKDGKVLRPLIAGATYGKGRVVVLGHGSIIDRENNLGVANAIVQWVQQSKKPIGLFTNYSSPAFRDAKVYRSLSSLKQATEECSALFFDQSPTDNDFAAIDVLDQYVKNGGGLVLAGPLWGWQQLNPSKSFLKDHSGQALLARMGLGFAEGTIDPNGKGQISLLAPQPAHHVATAVAMMKSRRVLLPEEAKVVGETLETAMGSLAPENPLAKQIEAMLNVDLSQVRPTKEKPLTSEQFQLRLAAKHYDKTWRTLPPEQVKASPAAQDFPGPVLSSDREDMTVKIGGKMRHWWSTGAYAAPGEVITVRLPEELKRLGIRLRIGGHNDTLWHLDKWERFPSIALEVPIKDGVAKAANPFGGLVYLVCDKALPAASVDLEHVVPAPVYFLGRTTDAQWQKLRNSSAPWGEVVANNCVVCVPSAVLKTLDNPKPVAEYWDEVVDQVEFLYSEPRGSREERYQVDRQISAGYMHSGYPIMTWEDVSQKFVSIDILRGKNGDTNWGFYHEIGHNFQKPSWTWEGWGETTNNLYSLFGCEHFNGDMSGGHGAMKEDKRLERMKAVLAAPGKEDYFDKDPWYGLTFLRAIREEFGWKPFQDLFAEFRALPRSEQPKSEDEKHDQFLVRMSRILKRDLSKYFEMWGVKNSADAKAKCSQYTQWLPKSMS